MISFGDVVVEDTILEVLVAAIDRPGDEVTCRLAKVSPLDFACVKTHGRRSVEESRKTGTICMARRKGGSFDTGEISQLLSFSSRWNVKTFFKRKGD